MKKNVRGLFVQPQKPGVTKILENNWESIERELQAQKSCVRTPFFDDIVLFSDSTAKLKGKPLNRAAYDEEGVAYDIIAGDFFLCRMDEDSCELESLTDEQLSRCRRFYQNPEYFTMTDKGVLISKYL